MSGRREYGTSTGSALSAKDCADTRGIVTMHNSEGSNVRVHWKAFEDTYRDQGWELTEPTTAPAPALDEPAAPVAEHTHDSGE
jgi:hypothetical protein